MNITLDIETIPTQDERRIAEIRDDIVAQAEAEIAALKPPGNIKDQVKIEAWNATERPAKEDAIRAEAETKADEKYRATSFDGALGRIAVIGYAIDSDEPVTLYADPFDHNAESSLLVAFFTAIERAHQSYRDMCPVFIGHNVVDFDLRFIYQRAVVLGVKPPAIIPFNAKPWDDVVFDTMTRWAGIRGRVSLAKLCDALGLPAKGIDGEEIDGSMVWDMVKAGRIADVAKYCAGDIERTRAIHKRLTFAARPYPIAEESFGLEAA